MLLKNLTKLAKKKNKDIYKRFPVLDSHLLESAFFCKENKETYIPEKAWVDHIEGTFYFFVMIHEVTTKSTRIVPVKKIFSEKDSEEIISPKLEQYHIRKQTEQEKTWIQKNFT